MLNIFCRKNLAKNSSFLLFSRKNPNSWLKSTVFGSNQASLKGSKALIQWLYQYLLSRTIISRLLGGWQQSISRNSLLSDIWDILPWLDNLDMGQKWSRVFVFRSFSNNKFTSGREKVVEVSYRLQTARIKALRARIWPVHQRTKRYGCS